VHRVPCRPLKYADGTHIERCDFRLERNQYRAYYMADLTIFYVIPLLLTCVLYSLIARILFASARPTFSSSTRQSAAAADNTRHPQQRGGHNDTERKNKAELVPRRCTAQVQGARSSASSRIQVSDSRLAMQLFPGVYVSFTARLITSTLTSSRIFQRNK